jgi:hypothetical protein
MKKQAAIQLLRMIRGDESRECIYESKLANNEEISKLAFRLYESRGWQHGNDVEDWLRAEQELVTSCSQR